MILLVTRQYVLRAHDTPGKKEEGAKASDNEKNNGDV